MTFGFFSKIDCSNIVHLNTTLQLTVYLITVFVTTTTKVNKYTPLIRKRSIKILYTRQWTRKGLFYLSCMTIVNLDWIHPNQIHSVVLHYPCFFRLTPKIEPDYMRIFVSSRGLF